jgi:aryl-alcohol dehydrogenase-like predicted oxidoreductase
VAFDREIQADQTDISSARRNSVSRYFSERNWQLLDLMDKIAEPRNGTVSQVALSWLLHQPDITSRSLGRGISTSCRTTWALWQWI